MSPLEDNITQDANERVGFLRSVLTLNGKDDSSVTVPVGDTCNANRSFSVKMEKPLVGCASHRFQLSVNEILGEEESVVSQVKGLMAKLCSPLISAKLRI